MSVTSGFLMTSTIDITIGIPIVLVIGTMLGVPTTITIDATIGDPMTLTIDGAFCIWMTSPTWIKSYATNIYKHHLNW